MSEESGAGSESPQDTSNTIDGTVKWFNDAKGFGFIEHAEGDVFVHYSVIEASGFKTLKDGEDVLYEFKQGPKGLHAVRVIRKNQPETQEQAAPEKTEARDDSTPKKTSSSGLAARVVQQVVPDTSQSDSMDEDGPADVEGVTGIIHSENVSFGSEKNAG